MLPEVVSQAWDGREGPVVLVTMDKAGTPNAIYATCVGKFDEETLVVADNYFGKTRANLLEGDARGVILFITGDNAAYQVKGTLSYHTSGPVFDFMKTWNPEKHPGHAAAALKVEEVYKGSERLA
jgi:predicted pyridoxine 5'-phosphate oxidase superfamily flavin-nucleotide-binding protein